MIPRNEARFWARALRAYAVVREVGVALTAVGAAAPGSEVAVRLAPGDAWPDPGADRLELVAVGAIPWARPRLSADLDGETLVTVDGRVTGALNACHRTLDTDLPPGERRLHLEVLPTGLMGVRHRPPRVRAVAWQEVDRALEGAAYDLDALVEWASSEALPDAAREAGWAAIAHALAPLRALPPDRAAWTAWVARADVSAEEEGLRAVLAFGEGEAPQLRGLPAQVRDPALAEATGRLRAAFGDLAGRFPRGRGRLVAMGHAHIDTAWLWPVAVGEAKAVRTFATQAALLRDNDAIRFGASAPAHYLAVAREAPDLFARVQALAEQGRFVPLGAMWVEADSQLPDAGAVVRHLLYGLRYLRCHLGVRSRVAFLPDSFGFAGGLPTLLAAAGVRIVCTTKLNWNDTTRFPYTDFTWVGPDGSSVQAHVFGQGPGGYNGSAELADLVGAWDGYERAGGRGPVLYTYGHGDGGGGPTAAMAERLARYRQLPLLPEVVHAGPEALLDAADPSLPRYRGPLYLEYHRGTYTSQSWLKRLNREATAALAAAEAFEAWAARGAGPSREDDWRIVLRNQFHDILPGSSVRAVNARAEAEGRSLVDRAYRRIDDALGKLVAPGPPALVVANLSGQASPGRVVHVDRPVDAARASGRALRVQAVDGGALVEVPPLEPFGLTVVALDAASATAAATPPSMPLPTADGAVCVTAGGLRVDVDDAGIAGIWLDGERLVDRARVRAYRQHPDPFDAWELVAPADRSPVDLEHAPLEAVCDGPLRTAVRLRHRTAWGTEIVEEVALDRLLGQVDLRVQVTPAERHLVVAYEARTVLRTADAVAGSMVGVDRHPGVPAGPADAARFEWPAHAWVDVSEPGLGLALLDDGRYGHAFADGVVSVTLVTTPLFPDPRADESPAPARLALVAHHGDWRAADVDLRAQALGAGVRAVVMPAGEAPAPAPLAGLPPGLRLLGVKGAEDGSGDLVVHLLEVRGTRGEAALHPAIKIAQAQSVDLVDEAPCDDAGQVSFDRASQALTVAWLPYALLVVRLRPAPA